MVVWMNFWFHDDYIVSTAFPTQQGGGDCRKIGECQVNAVEIVLISEGLRDSVG